MHREEVIPILRVLDAEASARWYEQLGFELTNVHRFAPGMPAFATIQRGDITLFLSEHAGDARPDTLVYLRVNDSERWRNDSAASSATTHGVPTSRSPIRTATDFGSTHRAGGDDFGDDDVDDDDDAGDEEGDDAAADR